MDRYVSQLIPHPRTYGDGPTYGRADLIFYDVDPIGDSYRALVFLNVPEADHRTETDKNEQFAGWFTVFGHGGCFGDDERHCAPPTAASPFDLRMPVGIPRQTKIVTITEALDRISSSEFTVTVVAVMPGDEAAQPTDSMEFGRLRLITYE
jgi:hypothetical protein